MNRKSKENIIYPSRERGIQEELWVWIGKMEWKWGKCWIYNCKERNVYQSASTYIKWRPDEY